MKKILFCTSGLVAVALAMSAPARSAEKVKLGVRGFMEMGVGLVDNEEDAGAREYGSWGIISDTEVHFLGSTKLENGLSVGYKIEFEANLDRENVSVDEVFLDISSDSLGLLRIGDDPVSALVATGAPMVGWGLEDAAYWVDNSAVLADSDWIGNPIKVDGHSGADDNLKVSYWTPSDWEKATGLQASVSLIPTTVRGDGNDAFVNTVNDPGFAVAYGLSFDRNFGDVGTYVGYGYYRETDSGRAGEDNFKNYEGHNIGMKLSMGPWEAGGAYQRTLNKAWNRNALAGGGNDSSSHDGWSWNLGGAYRTGKWTLGLAYAYSEVDDDTASPNNDENTVWEFAAKYDLGSGVAWTNSLFLVDYRDETGVDANYNSGGWALVTGLVLGF